MGMHPVARFNLGKGKKGTRMHLVISGQRGNGELHFEPNSTFPYWNNQRNVIEATIEEASRIYLEVNFAKGGGSKKSLNFSIIAPEDFEVLSSNFNEFNLNYVLRVPPDELSSRGFDSNYRKFVFYFRDSYLSNSKVYKKDIVISTRYKGKIINLDFKIRTP